jgi:purine-binding chemotaxis protein CheW
MKDPYSKSAEKDSAEEKAIQLVIFTLDERRFALTLSSVERVVRAVDVTPLPSAPSSILGVVNVRGEVVPVYNLRRRFRLTERDLDLSDHLMIANTSRRTVGLLVDSVEHVLDVTEEMIASAEKILPKMECVHGVVKLPDGLVLIHALDQFLSAGEERALETALNRDPSRSDCVMRND